MGDNTHHLKESCVSTSWDIVVNPFLANDNEYL